MPFSTPRSARPRGSHESRQPSAVDRRPGDEQQDTGSWWIEGDSYCRRWQTWLDGQSACFGVSIADGKVTWVDTAAGASVVETFTPEP